jgi:hypothetical protein
MKLKPRVEREQLHMTLREDSDTTRKLGSIVKGGNRVMEVQLRGKHYRMLSARSTKGVGDVEVMMLVGEPERDQEAEDAEMLAATIEMYRWVD